MRLSLEKKLIDITNNIKPIHLWLIYFLYSLVFGIIFSEFIIPKIPSLHAPNSLLTPDAFSYNEVATKLAQDISLYGWSSWTLYPATGSAGQSSFLAIIYVFFGANPIYAVPFNAFFHALSGILIYLIAKEILGYTYPFMRFAFLPATLFVIFPSAMSWVSQINKDVCLATGFLLSLWAILRVLSSKERGLEILKFSIVAILSGILIASMKPYMLQVLLFIILIMIVLQLIKILPFSLISFCWLLIYIFIVGGTFLYITQDYSKREVEKSSLQEKWLSGDNYIEINQNQSYQWNKTPLVPKFIDSKLEAMSSARSSFIYSGLNIRAKSMIDVNDIPDSAIEVFKYLPRGFQISWLAPFPDTWLNANNLVSYVSGIEMLICYLAFLGLIFYLIRGSLNYRILVCFVFAFIPLLVFGITIPNIGTLYRVRYPFEMIFLTMGVCGWAHLIKKIKANELD